MTSRVFGNACQMLVPLPWSLLPSSLTNLTSLELLLCIEPDLSTLYPVPMKTDWQGSRCWSLKHGIPMVCNSALLQPS